ncbi:MAG: TIGR02921 family PEP-CTERM protein, partial [Chloroflexota bacterium]
KAEQRSGWLGILKAIGLACLIAIGLYASVWIAFYAIPFSSFILEGIGEFFRNIPEFFEFLWRDLGYALAEGVRFLFFAVFGGLLFGSTAVLFVLLPRVVPWLYVKTWLVGNKGIGQIQALGVLAAVIVVIGGSLAITDRQPQLKAFELLEQTPSTPIEAVEILNQADDIRAGLLNSYLARTRYLSALQELDHIRWIYDDAFAITFERGLAIQNRYEFVARPFLYQPVTPIEPAENQNARWQQGSRLVDEPDEAAELYEKFFDEHINDGEKEEVVRAVRTTWDPAQAERAWQAVDDREIHLVDQNLTHEDLGNGIHGFELHEVYANKTTQRQEVVYYFSLPESAVITGVWLGSDNQKIFDFQVAPRGAAQQVYQEQVQRRVDPALVEQIGPQQYRLRIFPIEPRTQRWDDSVSLTPTFEDGEFMHMWLTWQVLEQDGQIPLPQLSVLRNVFWDENTQRSYPAGLDTPADDWLPTQMTSSNPMMTDHSVIMSDGRTVIAQSSNVVIPELPADLKVAIVLDRSFSMSDYAAEIEAALSQFERFSPEPMVYLTASEYRGSAPSVKGLSAISADDLIYFGGQNSAEIMQQFQTFTDGSEFDAIFVLTDDGTFSTTANETETVAVPEAPVWMIHLSDTLPNGYDDNTLEIIQASGGGAASSLDEAFGRLAVLLSGQSNINIVDGYEWMVLEAGQSGPANSIVHTSDSPFAKMAARQLILADMRANKGRISDVALLDSLHEIALDQAIVTPFSSMIVLVNQAQKDRLEELENQDDRFQ